MYHKIIIHNSQILFNDVYVRIVFDSFNNPWFAAKDVAKSLNYKDTKDAIKVNVDVSDKKQIKHIIDEQSISKLPYRVDVKTLYLTESGLYTLIMKSKMKKAKQFQLWISKNVLPALRKYGKYEHTSNNLINELDIKLKNANDEITILKNNQNKTKYPNGNHVYIMKQLDLKNKDQIYKIGITKNLNKRANVYNTGFANNVKFLYYHPFDNLDKIELCLEFYLFDYRYRHNREFYQCKLDLIIQIIEKCNKYINMDITTMGNIERLKIQSIFLDKDVDLDKEYIFKFEKDLNDLGPIEQLGSSYSEYKQLYIFNKSNYKKLKKYH